MHRALKVSVLSLTFAAFGAQPDSRTPPGIAVPPEAYDRPSIPLAGPTFEEQVVVIVNQERLTYGGVSRPPLKHNALLDTSSEGHSTAMGVRDFFAHCDLDTLKWPDERIQDAGYYWNTYGENIAAGYATPTSVMNGWMGSSGHRGNILSTGFREIGVGYYFNSPDLANIREDGNSDCVADSFGHGPFGHYWTQNFGRRTNVYPVVINREAYETSSQTVNLYVYGTDFPAVQMRFRNDTGAWSSWESYNEDKVWTLSAGAGTKEVFAEIKNGSGTVRSASDTIILTAPGPAASFYTLDPCRVIDTRNPNGELGGPALSANQDRGFVVVAACGIPSNAVALSVNIAVTGATAPGNLRLHPGGTSVPVVSAINYAAFETRSNNAVVPLNVAGQLAIFASQSSGTVHVILDVNGYFE